MLDSLLRHVMALANGEKVDPDSKSGATHYDSILANALLLSELRPQDSTLPERTDLDEDGGRTDGDGVYRIDGYDSQGFDISGFDHGGIHKAHDFNDPGCNCPSCR